MPFPLAHPAAVLPLRGLCSRHLNFFALVIGAITPDLSYCFERYDVDVFAHTLRGCFGFSLPVGWLITLVFFAVREPLIKVLPAPHRQMLLPSCRPLAQEWYAVPLGVLIGAVTHVAWDSFSHDTGWWVERSSFLQRTLFTLDGYPFRLYRLFWHLSTWAGLLVVYFAYRNALKKSTGSARLFAAEEKPRYAFWGGILFFPFAAVLPFTVRHLSGKSLDLPTVAHFIRIWLASYLVTVSVVLVFLGIGLRLRRTVDQ